jgi:hypothetical protein
MVSAGQLQEFEFIYRAQGTIEEGKVELTVPPGWPAPTEDSTKEGFTSAEIVSDVDAEDVGTVTLSFDEEVGSVTAEISLLSAIGQTLHIRYGDSDGDMAGVTVPAGEAGRVFGVRTQGSSDDQGGRLRELRSTRPRVEVTAPDDGFGTAEVEVQEEPYHAGSPGNEVTVIFRATADVDDGSVSVEVPMYWTPPEGHVEVAPTGIGEVTYSDQMVIVDNVTLTAGDTIIFTYSDATAQGTAESATFIVKSKGSADGIFTELGASAATDDSETPNIDESESPYRSDWMVDVVNAADGTGTLVANPDIVVAGGTIELIELTYMPVGTMDEGVLRVTVPSSWTPPSNDLDAPGYVSAVAEGGGSVLPAEADAASGEISVFITTLPPEGTIVISYKNVTAPAEPEESEFMAQSNGGGVRSSSEDLMAGPATIKVRLSADSLAITSDLQTVFTNQVSDAITIEIQEGDEAAAATVEVTVTLMSSSDAGMFDTAMDGAFDGTVTSVMIPAGETSVDVYYKDSVAGDVTLTATVPLGETEQMVTQDITVSMGATALALATTGTLFSDGMIEIMLETQDDAGNATASGADVVVTLSSSSEMGSFMVNGNPLGEDMTVTVMAGETSPMGTLTYTDTTVGMATLMATAEDLTDAMPLEVMVNNVIGNVTVEPMMAMAGEDVTVTAIAKPGLMPVPSFTVGDIVQTGIDMLESPDGTYTGMFTVIAEVHADGTYDVVVTVGEGADAVMETEEITIDSTPPVITVSEPETVQNGDMVTLTVTSEESGLTVTGTGLQALDTLAESDELEFMESTDTPGTYTASHMISAGNEANNGMYMISVTAVDAVENTSAVVSISVHLQNGSEFELTVPEGLSLIHIPLKVTSVNGENQMLNNISDLYVALGADDVTLLTTYDVEAEKWVSFIGAGDKGSPADREITADLGILASMNNEVTRILRGEAWGENGVSMISLKAGLNLVGIPLDSAELNMVSHLLSDDVKVIIVSDEGVFKPVTAPTDSGNGPIEGGRSYIVTAAQDVTIEVTGEAWSSMPSTGITAAPVAIPHIVAVDGATPVLAIRGSITGESRGIAQVDLRITVRNLSTGASVSVVSGGEGDAGQYDVTFVDTKAARAAQVGDVLEIKAESPNPLVGVQPLRHIISVDDVKNSRIQLAELVPYEIPAKTELLLNYPNPFNPETWIPFRLAKDSQVNLTIYDRTGRVVRSLDVGHRSAAVYESRAKAIYWDGRNNFGERVASGMYFYTLIAKDFSATRRMVILK